MVHSKFLDLPNELILELFRYFDAPRLLFSFHGLIARLNSLIAQSPTYHVTLTTPSSLDLFLHHRQAKHIRSLSIPSDDQLELFERLMAMPAFVANCEALSIGSISAFDFPDVIHSLPDFKKLTSLTITRTSEMDADDRYDDLLDMIIRNALPTLKRFKLIAPDRSPLTISNRQKRDSNILEGLVLSNATAAEIASLAPYLPRLKRVTIHSFNYGRFDIVALPTTITNLNLKTDYHTDLNFVKLTAFLSIMPKLSTITLIAFGRDLTNGHQWQRLIETSLPSLVTFQFHFQVYPQDANATIETYRTSFWSRLRRWSVRYGQPEAREMPERWTRIFGTLCLSFE